jgi:hypothetical protein
MGRAAFDEMLFPLPGLLFAWTLTLNLIRETFPQGFYYILLCFSLSGLPIREHILRRFFGRHKLSR